MTALIRAQVVQLRTPRSTYLVAGPLLALVTLITGITMSEAGSPDLRTASQLREPLVASAGIMIAVVMAIFAALLVHGALAALVLAGTTFALLGAAVGSLTRSQAPAVVTALPSSSPRSSSDPCSATRAATSRTRS
jgi:hypothetical protein